MGLADHYGVELRRTLTGFKYIGEQIGFLEKAGEEGRYLFGFEESFGYLSGTHVRDKDAVNACLLICGMAAACKREGRRIPDVLAELKQEYGDYRERLLTYDFKGTDGMGRMKRIMSELREKPLERLSGKNVVGVIDYASPEKTGLPLSDVIEFRLEDGSRVTVRPSGTEPKMKVYLSLKGKEREGGKEAEDDCGILRELRIVV